MATEVPSAARLTGTSALPAGLDPSVVRESHSGRSENRSSPGPAARRP